MRIRTAFVVLTGAGLLLPLTACGGGDGAPMDQSAAVMCEEFMKKRIKGKLDFSGVMDTKITKLTDKAPWKYKVTGYVDKENVFGGNVRNDYTCAISTKDDDTWNLGDLKLTES